MLFISCQKLFLFLRYLNFCLDFLVMQKNGLIRKLRLISEYMASQTGYQQLQCIYYPMSQIREIFFFKNHLENEAGYAIEINFITSQAVDPEICSVLIFFKKIWDQIFDHILRTLFCLIVGRRSNCKFWENNSQINLIIIRE